MMDGPEFRIQNVFPGSQIDVDWLATVLPDTMDEDKKRTLLNSIRSSKGLGFSILEYYDGNCKSAFCLVKSGSRGHRFGDFHPVPHRGWPIELQISKPASKRTWWQKILGG